MNSNVLDSYYKAFVDKDRYTHESLHNKLLINNEENNERVLDTLKDELKNCTSFVFNVAFITEAGLNELKTILNDLKIKGVNGKIITSTYLGYNSPKVFETLLKLENVETYIYEKDGYHPKGYFFEHEDHLTLIMGSSNLTANALKINTEWNLRLTSTTNGEIIEKYNKENSRILNSSRKLDNDWLSKYKFNYVPQSFYELEEEKSTYHYKDIEPNKMQQAALKGIDQIRENGANKGLIISATGTGKTFLSAFDVKKANPKKVLFIAHREQILKESINDFKRVFNNSDHDYGVFSGASKEINKKFVFSTIQTISKDRYLKLIAPEEFDYIVIDEVHRAGAESYLKVIDYFEPDFLLGMTATPERTDNFNIFELFDYNIAYEIRLQEALEEDMLCPFYYYGVTDYVHEGETIEETSNLDKLLLSERVDYLIKKIDYYGHSGETPRGLIFCSRKEEAAGLSNEMNKKGFKTLPLTGEDDIDTRLEVIELLEKGLINYIITVDIFNEGVDIPSVNQIIMMRNTESSIIFTQQLGRGLRKHDSKEFVTIIDFIGNYKNNYLIPIALSGDTSMNKDIIRDKILDSNYISGLSSINFEKIAEEKVLTSLDGVSLTGVRNLKDQYFSLKNKICRIPLLKDFIDYNSIDPEIIANYNLTKIYHRFLLKYEDEYNVIFNDEQERVLLMMTRELLNGKRVHELWLLQYLIKNKSISWDTYFAMLKEHEIYVDQYTKESITKILDMSYFTELTCKQYPSKSLIKIVGNTIELSDYFRQLLKHDEFSMQITDIIETALLKNQAYDNSKQFTIGEIYTRSDASRLLNWDSDRTSTIYGYQTHRGSCPFFNTYHKKDVEDSIDYGDEFLDLNTFRQYTRSNRTTESNEVIEIIEAEETNTKLHLFVKKDDATYESNYYYYGEMTPIKSSIENQKMRDGKNVVKIDMRLKNPISLNQFNYLEQN